jgi:hypothetical protein
VFFDEHGLTSFTESDTGHPNEGNTAQPTSPTPPPDSSKTADSSDDKNSNSNKASKTSDKSDNKSDDNGKKTTTTKKGGKATHTTFDLEAPPGSIIMETPNVFAASAALYKIGDYITWGWNYTNLLGTPTAIDVLISCSTASETWTLTSNMTFKTAGSYTWDSSVQESSIEEPLPVAMYTLIIKDSDTSITALPDPGYLGTFTQFTFGLYTPQPYLPFNEWTCDACNAALSKFDHHVLGFAITMGLVTVLSFTWFVSGVDIQ